MPALQVRDCPIEIYEALQARAAKEHRSMAQQTIVALEEHLQNPPRQPVRFAENEYAWMDGDAEERRARAERKKKVFERIDKLNATYDIPKMSSEELVQIRRNSWEERTDHILSVLAGNQPALEEIWGESR